MHAYIHACMHTFVRMNDQFQIYSLHGTFAWHADFKGPGRDHVCMCFGPLQKGWSAYKTAFQCQSNHFSFFGVDGSKGEIRDRWGWLLMSSYRFLSLSKATKSWLLYHPDSDMPTIRSISRLSKLQLGIYHPGLHPSFIDHLFYHLVMTNIAMEIHHAMNR